MKKNITITVAEKYNKETIKNMLKNKDFAYKALMMLYNRQTADEKTKKIYYIQKQSGF